MKTTTKQVLVGAAIGTGVSVAIGLAVHVVIRREIKKVVAVKKAEAVQAAKESPFCGWV